MVSKSPPTYQPPAPSDGINRSSGNIRKESVARLQKRLLLFVRVHRNETLLLLIRDVTELLKKAKETREAVDKKDVRMLGRAYKDAEKNLRDIPAEDEMALISSGISRLQRLENAEPEEKSNILGSLDALLESLKNKARALLAVPKVEEEEKKK